MDRLKNKTILIGKDPNQSRLLVSVKVNGQTKTAAIGDVGNVPNSVSRNQPTENIAHCALSVDNNGSLKIMNLKPQNVTFVNGSEIMSKKISSDAKVALGKDRYPLPVGIVVETAKRLVGNVPPPPLPPVQINHLEKIWDDYEKTNENIAIQIQERGRKRMLPMVVGSASGLFAPLLASVFSTSTLYVTAPISIISFIIYFKIYNEKDTSINDKKTAQDKLIDNYICPNDKCRHFLGYQPYKIIRQNKKCPYCGCSWMDNK